MLPKEEKKVKDEEVVVRHGGGDRELPLALEGALQDTVALAKTLHNCLEEQKTKGVKRGGKALHLLFFVPPGSCAKILQEPQCLGVRLEVQEVAPYPPHHALLQLLPL